MVYELGGFISGGQKGRGRKMRGTPNTQTTRIDREGGLKPGWILRTKIYVSDSRDNGPQYRLSHDTKSDDE